MEPSEWVARCGALRYREMASNTMGNMLVGTYCTVKHIPCHIPVMFIRLPSEGLQPRRLLSARTVLTLTQRPPEAESRQPMGQIINISEGKLVRIVNSAGANL